MNQEDWNRLDQDENNIKILGDQGKPPLLNEELFHDPSGSVVYRRFLAPEFKSSLGYVLRVFHISYLLNAFGGRWPH